LTNYQFIILETTDVEHFNHYWRKFVHLFLLLLLLSISLIILHDMIRENFHALLVCWQSFESACATTHHCVTHVHTYWSLSRQWCHWDSSETQKKKKENKRIVCRKTSKRARTYILMFVCILAERERTVDNVFAWLKQALKRKKSTQITNDEQNNA
jgi:hypothetical protein